MPEYLSPGVYVEERDTGAKAIEGVSTTTTGFVGVSERGVVGVPTLVIGTADFERQFGGLLDRRIFTGDTWYLPHAVRGFFDNGGKRLYIVRVAENAKPATASLFDRGKTAGGIAVELAALARTGDKSIVLTNKTGIAVNDWLKLSDEDMTEYVKVASTTNGAKATQGVFAFDHDIGVAASTVTLGAPSSSTTVAALATAGGLTITLAAAGPTGGDVLQVGTAPTREYVVVKSAAGTVITLAYPMAYPHNSPDPVDVVPIATRPTTAHLSAVVKAGDRAFTLDNGAGFGGPGVLVEFLGAPNQTEYRLTDDISAAKLTAGVSNDHSAGAEVTLQTTAAVTPFTLNAAPGQGVTQITLTAPPAGLAAGDFLVLGGAADSLSEVVSVGPNIAGAAVDVSTTANAHLVTDPVIKTRRITQLAKAGETTLVLHDVTGIVAPSFLEIGLASKREIGSVKQVDSGTKIVTLDAPLVNDHAIGSSATPITLTAGTKALLAEPLLGGSDLLLTDGGAYSPDEVLSINGTTAEYRIVGSSLTVGAVGLADPIAQIHTGGVDVVDRNPMITVEAIDPGAWGNALRVTVEDEDKPGDAILETKAPNGASIGATSLNLVTAVGIEKGTVLDINGNLIKVTGVAPNQALFSGGLPFAVAINAKVRTREFRITVGTRKLNKSTGKYTIVPNEVHRRLSMDPDHSRFFARVIGRIYIDDVTTPRRADGHTEGESDLIRVADTMSEATARATIRLGPDLTIDLLPNGDKVAVPTPLLGGDDDIGGVDDKTYIGSDSVNPKDRLGLFALQNIEDISIVAIPGRTGQALQQALLNHCELMRYRFGVLDSGRDEKLGDVQVHRSLFDSKFGALYYPWPRIDDPFPDNPAVGGEVPIPPSGHLTGIYARSDIERGVHKAPANEVVRGIVGLQEILAKAEQDVLNPKGICVIRDFTESLRGRRVWGARTVSSDPDWKYINVRRLFIFIEHSLDNGTQWVVFEPNSELLWQRVIRVIRAFLLQVWRDGALMGLKPDQAFYVKCDRTTMTQNDIDNGRLIVEIGIAPVKPAEFVIIRIGQWTASADQE